MAGRKWDAFGLGSFRPVADAIPGYRSRRIQPYFMDQRGKLCAFGSAVSGMCSFLPPPICSRHVRVLAKEKHRR